MLLFADQLEKVKIVLQQKTTTRLLNLLYKQLCEVISFFISFLVIASLIKEQTKLIQQRYRTKRLIRYSITKLRRALLQAYSNTNFF
jgi:hypothetical protein